MTVEDLWQEYRAKCCPPELGETSESLHWQRVAFLSGAMATLGNILIRPSCFNELRESVVEWMAKEDSLKN